MSYRLIRHGSTRLFLQAAGAFLADDELQRGFVWGLANQSVDRSGPIETPWTWTLHGPLGTVVGALYWSPPRRALALTDMPKDAGHALTEELLPLLRPQQDTSGEPRLPWRIPGWIGPEHAVTQLAKGWEDRDWGPLEERQHFLLHRCDALDPVAPITGRLRNATRDDLRLLHGWLERFWEETGLGRDGSSPPGAERPVREQRLFLWEDGQRPVACAQWSRPTPRSAAIGFVYVPPDLRRRGYATAVTRALTEHLLQVEGKRFTTLFTVAGNENTAQLYAALGYRQVGVFRELGPSSAG